MSDPRPEVDFDHHSPQYARDFRSTYKDMRSKCPVAWSNRHGGYWVVTRYDDIAEVARDDYTFSSRHDLPNGNSYTGIVLPPNQVRSTPIEMDPPQFQAYRQILTKWFSPAYAEKVKPQILRYVTECLDDRIESGSIDFILHLANPIPGIVTMVFLGLPAEDWELYAPHYHNGVAYPPGTPEHEAASRGILAALDRVREAIAERRRQPREDLLTHLTRVEVEGAKIPDETIVDICNLILGGGLDTTTGLMGHGLDYLGRHPQLRARLLADPKLIMMNFCEELLRFNTPTQALSRTATKDVEVGGQKIKAGERLLICWASANHDESKFDKPEEFNIDRFPNLHQAFGLGGHRCLGSTFARYEFSIAVEQVLKRMPDYRLAEGAEHYQSIGVVNGWHRLPATFTPGARVGAAASSSYL
ncbi:MAG: cytochrome P450 [Gammaproteobacteria bacterium]